MDVKPPLLLMVGIFLSCVNNVCPTREFNLYHQCGKVISMISNNIKGALLYYERPYGFNTYDTSGNFPCTVELWGWFDNDIAMHFRSFNTSAKTHVEIRQGDFWEDSRPIRGMPERLSGTVFDRMNHVFTSDWMGIFIRIGGDTPPREVKIFELALNVFHTAGCKSWEFSCDNGWCIDKDLKCNGYNPCGDSSDCKPDGISTGVIAVICVSVAAGGTCIGTILYYALRSVCRNSCKTTAELASSVTRNYAQASIGRDDTDLRENDRYTNNVWNDDITVSDRQHVNRDTDLINSQRYGYTVPGIHSNNPPNYNTVMTSDQSGSNISNQEQNTQVPSPPDYNSTMTDHRYAPSAPSVDEIREQHTPSAPTEEVLGVDNNTAELPSYADVLQNENAYALNLTDGSTVVYRV